MSCSKKTGKHHRALRRAASASAHLCLAVALTLLTFFFVDRVNPQMAFVDHKMSKALISAEAAIILFECAACSYGAVTDRRLSRSKGRWAPSVLVPFYLLATAVSISMLALVGVDAVYPEKILFTQTAPKAVFAAVGFCGLAVAVVAIVGTRRQAFAEYLSANVKGKRKK